MKKLCIGFAVMMSVSAFAADMTNPFFIPEQGRFLSQTSAEYVNFKPPHTRHNQSMVLTEELTVGVVDDLALTGMVANEWQFDYEGAHKHNRWRNPAWALGMKLNIPAIEEALKTQVAVRYTQGKTNTFQPIFEHQYQVITGEAKIGYETAYGLIPYVGGIFDKIVGKYCSDPLWTGRVGLFNNFDDVVTGDIGVSYGWDMERTGWTAGLKEKHANVLTIDMAADYMLDEDMAIGLTAKYVMRSLQKDAEYRHYTIGVNFKIGF